MKRLNCTELSNYLELSELKNLPTFGALPDYFVVDLLADGESLKLNAREKLFHSGENSDCFFIVLKGQVRLYQGKVSGKKYLLTHKAGESTGFASMLALQPRVGDAVADEGGAIALKISSELFSSLYEQEAQAFSILLLNLTRNMSRSLRSIAASVELKPEKNSTPE